MASFKEIIKHGGNYLIANLATKALAFISIPIYTRLLSPNEYGIYSLFLGTVSILSSILTLCVDQSISRYFFEQKSSEDFKRFTGTSSILAIIVFFITTSFLIICADPFAKLIGLNKNLILWMIPFSIVNIIGLTFEQIYGPLKESKIIATSSLYRVYIGFAFSILFIVLIKVDKYYGPIIGQLIAGLFMIVFWIKKIAPFIELSFDKKYIKYIFSYSVPLIPYALSGVIIEQFGKISIGSSQSVSKAGFYSLALLISSIVSIVISVAHQAWNPYYFEYMNSKNYIQHDKDQSKIFRITLLVAVIVSAFANEIGSIITSKEYLGAFSLIPIFTIGYVFYQLAYVYMRNFSFSKKTQYLTLTVLISGISNIIFNMLLVETFHGIGAAISFSMSYIIMAILAWFFNKYFVKHYGTSIVYLLKYFAICLPFYALIYSIGKIDSIFILIPIKILIVILLSLLLFWKEKFEVLNYIKKLN